MSELTSMIRLSRWKLDEKRRALEELRALADRLAGEIRRLEEEVKGEQGVARVSTEASFGYGAYARAAIARRRKLEESIAEVNRQIEVATEDLGEAFQELKRFELTQQSRDRREQVRQRRRDTAVMDEVGQISHARRRQSRP